MWICVAHHREHASNALPLSVRRLISVKLAPALHQPTLRDVRMSRDVPVYSSSFHQVLTQPTHKGMTQGE